MLAKERSDLLALGFVGWGVFVISGFFVCFDHAPNGRFVRQVPDRVPAFRDAPFLKRLV